MLKGADFLIDNDQPEDIRIVFSSNGQQGGDAGHGCITELVFEGEGGSHSAIIGDDEIDLCEVKVHIIAQGDWEMEGMITAIQRLAKRLTDIYGDLAGLRDARLAEEHDIYGEDVDDGV